MHSKDRGPRIRTPQGKLLLFMLYFVGLMSVWIQGGIETLSPLTSVVDAVGPTGSAP
jgi:hypothetical protein